MSNKSDHVLPFSANNYGLKYGTDFFVYNPKLKIFYTEASNLGLAPGMVPEYFWIDNPKTGQIAVFDLMEIEQDETGQDCAFRYVSEDYGATAVVWNN